MLLITTDDVRTDDAKRVSDSQPIYIDDCFGRLHMPVEIPGCQRGSGVMYGLNEGKVTGHRRCGFPPKRGPPRAIPPSGSVILERQVPATSGRRGRGRHRRETFMSPLTGYGNAAVRRSCPMADDIERA